MTGYLLEVEALALAFSRQNGFTAPEELWPVRNLSLKLRAGEVLAVVGSSGSGKSLLAASILGILPTNCQEQGLIHYEGQELTQRRRQELCGRELRLIPQSVSYLNPLYTVKWQLTQAALGAGVRPEEVGQAINKGLTRYNLEPSVLKLYPHELSGGMARRVLTVATTFGQPRLLIADEPTCGLDESLTQESLKYLKSLATEGGCGVIIITHDLAAVTDFSDYITVFIDGISVETFQLDKVKAHGWQSLKHPYSQALWRALPEADFWHDLPHDFDRHSHGCPFASRCQYCQDICLKEMPPVVEQGREYVRCYR